MKRLQIYSALFAILSFLGILVAQLGSKDWFLDLANHFLPYLVVSGLIFGTIALAIKRVKDALRFLIVSFVILLLVEVGLRSHQPEGAAAAVTKSVNLRLISYNVLSSNESKEQVVRWLLNHLDPQKANLILLLELDPDWIKALQPLRDKLAYHHEDVRTDNFGIGLYSDRLFEKFELTTFNVSEVSAASAVLRLGSNQVHFYGVHPTPPFDKLSFETRNEFYRKLNAEATRGGQSTIIAGDFNSAPWSPNFYRIFQTFDNAFKGFFRENTWRQDVLVMPIDHVLFTPDLKRGSALIGPHMGSDHKPLLVDFN